jgi:GNAT superfamily N-acetyltransferase
MDDGHDHAGRWRLGQTEQRGRAGEVAAGGGAAGGETATLGSSLFGNRVTLMIRMATPADAPSLPTLLDQLGYPEGLGDVRSRLKRLLAGPESGVLVAESGGEVVGFGTFHFFELIYRSRPQCRLTALVVRFDHRRQGIGAALVDAIEQVARERGCSRIELTTRPGRDEAVPFYAALGFTERPHRLIKSLIDERQSDPQGEP